MRDVANAHPKISFNLPNHALNLACFNLLENTTMKTRLALLSVLGFGWSFLSLQADDRPLPKMPDATTAEHELNQAMKLQHYRMDGNVHCKSHSYPVSIVSSDWTMTLNFPSENLKYAVCLGPDTKSVQRTGPGGATHDLTPDEFRQHILATDITFEDISLSFTLWPCQGDIVEDSIKTLPAWCFTVTRPSGTPSNYGKVKIWMSSQFHGLLRVDCYDTQNNVIKRWEINDVSETQSGYTLKELMVNTMIPGRDISASQTFIDISSSEKLP